MQTVYFWSSDYIEHCSQSSLGKTNNFVIFVKLCVSHSQSYAGILGLLQTHLLRYVFVGT